LIVIWVLQRSLIIFAKNMRAIGYKKYNGSFEFITKEIPIPGKKELRIQVKAISLNPVDWKVHQGDLKFAFSPFFPKVIGFDFCGIVDFAGENTKYKAGDWVYGMLPMNYMGSASEYLVAPEYACSLVPQKLSPIEAASLPLAGLTAIHALITQAKIKKGNKILINGASGGVGTLAIQIAKSFGAEITAVCSEKNKALVFDLGANHHIDYQKLNPWDLNEKFDIVLDILSNLGFWRMRKRMVWGAHYVSVTPDAKAVLEFTTGWISGVFCHLTLAQPKAQDMKILTTFIETGELKPVIDQSFTWEQMNQAIEYSKSGRAKGKIVLTL